VESGVQGCEQCEQCDRHEYANFTLAARVF
jgi:hypothetical protein